MAGMLKVSSVFTTTNPIPKKLEISETKKCGFINRNQDSFFLRIGANSSTKLCAGFSQIEPDLNEDPKDRWATNGVAEEDFVYGKYDGHHTYFEEGGVKAPFWESIVEEYEGVGPPKGFQGLISWLFPPAVMAAMYFNAPREYLYIGAAIFTVVYCIIEMDKPSEAHNFEPQIYNLERGLRDKLISDYNSMNKWEFNEKYGELWDFTVDNSGIIKLEEN